MNRANIPRKVGWVSPKDAAHGNDENGGKPFTVLTSISRSISLILLILLVTALSTQAGEKPDVSGQTLTDIPDQPPAPDFALPDIDGNIKHLSGYHGKVVVLNFWATWCPPCRDEMPAMQHAWERVRDQDIVFLAVNIGETADEIFTFTGDYDVDFPLLMDQNSTVIKQWPIRGLPTTYVIDPEGRLVYRAIGGRAWDSPEILDKLLALARNSQNGEPAAHGTRY